MQYKKVNHERTTSTWSRIDKQYKPNKILTTVLLSLKNYINIWSLIEIYPIDIIHYIIILMYSPYYSCRRIDCNIKYIDHIWKYSKFDTNDLNTLYVNIYHCFGVKGKNCHNMVHVTKWRCCECHRVYCRECVHICSKDINGRDIRCLDCCSCKRLHKNKPQHIITTTILTLETFIKRISPRGLIIPYHIIYEIAKTIYARDCHYYDNSKKYICLKLSCTNNWFRELWQTNINPKKMKDVYNHCGDGTIINGVYKKCHKIGRNFSRCWNCTTFVCDNCVKRYCSTEDCTDNYSLIKKSCSECIPIEYDSDNGSEHTVSDDDEFNEALNKQIL